MSASKFHAWLQQWFQKHPPQAPPQEITQHFTQEVMQEIQTLKEQTPTQPAWNPVRWHPLMQLGCALASVALVIFIYPKQQEEPALPAQRIQVASNTLPVSKAESFQEMDALAEFKNKAAGPAETIAALASAPLAPEPMATAKIDKNVVMDQAEATLSLETSPTVVESMESAPTAPTMMAAKSVGFRTAGSQSMAHTDGPALDEAVRLIAILDALGETALPETDALLEELAILDEETLLNPS